MTTPRCDIIRSNDGAKLIKNANWDIQGGKRDYSSFEYLLYYTYMFLRRENSDLLNEFTAMVRKSFKLVDNGDKSYSYNKFDGYSFAVRNEVELLKLIKWCEDFKQNYDKEHPKKNLSKLQPNGENLEMMDRILNNLIFPEKQEDFDRLYSYDKGVAYLNKNCQFIYDSLVENKNEKKLDAFRKLINSIHFKIEEVTSTNDYDEEEIIGYQLQCQSRAVRNFINSYCEKIQKQSRRPAIQISNKDTMKLVNTLEEEDELTK